MSTSALVHNFRLWIRNATLAEMVILLDGIRAELGARGEPGNVECRAAAEIISRRIDAARAARRALGN